MYGCRLEMEHTRNFKCLGGLSPGIWQFSLSLKGIKYLRNSPWEKDLKKKKKTDSWSSDRWWHERSAGFWSPQCLKEHVPWDKRRSRRLYPEETPPDVKLFSVLFSCLLPFHHLPVTFLSDAKRQYFALSVIRALNLQNLGNWSSNYHLFKHNLRFHTSLHKLFPHSCHVLTHKWTRHWIQTDCCHTFPTKAPYRSTHKSQMQWTRVLTCPAQ